MKYRTTAKAIRQNCSNVVCAGYCDLQTILRNHSPSAYTCGIYGWNFDVYHVYDITITTGYRGMVGRRANNIDIYEAKAREIYDNRSISYEECSERIEALLKEFCEQA